MLSKRGYQSHCPFFLSFFPYVRWLAKALCHCKTTTIFRPGLLCTALLLSPYSPNIKAALSFSFSGWIPPQSLPDKGLFTHVLIGSSQQDGWRQTRVCITWLRVAEYSGLTGKKGTALLSVTSVLWFWVVSHTVSITEKLSISRK